jgi:phage shock protein A
MDAHELTKLKDKSSALVDRLKMLRGKIQTLSLNPTQDEYSEKVQEVLEQVKETENELKEVKRLILLDEIDSL